MSSDFTTGFNLVEVEVQCLFQPVTCSLK